MAIVGHHTSLCRIFPKHMLSYQREKFRTLSRFPTPAPEIPGMGKRLLNQEEGHGRP